jgi:hypothetical protein
MSGIIKPYATARVPVRVIVTATDHVPERLKSRHYVRDETGFCLIAYCYTQTEARTLKDALLGDGYSASFVI